MIQLFRVDSRLIHGQIVEGWLRAMAADKIIVIDDEIYANRFEKKILRFSVPGGLDFEVLTVEGAAQHWSLIKEISKKIVVLVQSVEYLFALYKAGAEMPEIDLGLVNYTDSKRALTKSVYIDDKEEKMLSELLGGGVEIYVQTLPSDDKIPLGKILKEDYR